MSSLTGARIVLAVSGGIAAYKAADLTSKLVQMGAVVEVVLTKSARHFIQPLTFQALTKRPVHTDVFEGWTVDSFGHVTLAREAGVLLVAPATANTIARLATGLADDMLGAVALATEAPLVLAPAMEHHMWQHPATRANLSTLMERGATVVPPEQGRLASGYEGDGRLATTPAILATLRAVLGRLGPLAGRRVVVTAGGTREPLDPVRYIGNRSTGKMGVALAEAARDAGASVTLIAGPTVPDLPAGLDILLIDTARELMAAVEGATADADALIMAAAVADFRAREVSESKIKKGQGESRVTLELERNPDILAGIDRPGLLKVGFAAETESLIENARQKLLAKDLSLIVANDAVATIGSEESTATLIRRGTEPETLPRMAKEELAARIIHEVAGMIAAKNGARHA
ncbi:MAG: bifunctional phosphopantothenoylcysteine decarboxylase/phosphopantothenate--cysteine ligase CoaBC [Chloroflexia bacterium]|nr:bifunctional phosphopantothenoylcysteine decarboxylase/phosphopantothenate--cysteine ligase CoaBC [Chloroflexia bacterium]